MSFHSRSVACELCGQQFFPSSLPFHIKQCVVKQQFVEVPCPHCDTAVLNCELDNHVKRLCPLRGKPVVASHTTVGGHKPCAVCGRKFASDRLVKHQVICRRNSVKAAVQQLVEPTAQPADPINSNWRKKRDEMKRRMGQSRTRREVDFELVQKPGTVTDSSSDFVEQSVCDDPERSVKTATVVSEEERNRPQPLQPLQPVQPVQPLTTRINQETKKEVEFTLVTKPNVKESIVVQPVTSFDSLRRPAIVEIHNEVIPTTHLLDDSLENVFFLESSPDNSFSEKSVYPNDESLVDFAFTPPIDQTLVEPEPAPVIKNTRADPVLDPESGSSISRERKHATAWTIDFRPHEFTSPSVQPILPTKLKEEPLFSFSNHVTRPKPTPAVSKPLTPQVLLDPVLNRRTSSLSLLDPPSSKGIRGPIGMQNENQLTRHNRPVVKMDLVSQIPPLPLFSSNSIRFN